MARATTSTVSRIRRGTSHALAAGEVAGDATSGELEAGVAEAFVTGSWSFPQSGCLPVTSLRVVLPLPEDPLPLEPLLLPLDVFVGTRVGVGAACVDDWLLVSMVGLVVICLFAEPSGMRA